MAVTSTSGSGAYHLDWQSGEIVHQDGRRWRPRKREQMVYAMLDACRGQALTAERLRDALWGNAIVEPDNVRQQVRHLRRLCGTQVIDTVPLYTPAHGGPKKCGYRVGAQ
jgi:DNA-binding winged helix-turn-helix (wHTH) protein